MILQQFLTNPLKYVFTPRQQ